MRVSAAFAAAGVASFGPVDLDPASPRYGHITSTPKPGWAQTDIAGPIRKALGVPVGFDTDVNAAALAEWRWGSAQGIDTFIYLTVGTGIGGGGLVNGRLMHGLVHPEMGHVRIPHDVVADPFAGACPFHRDCLEGLASGPAMQARWGRPAEELPDGHPAWMLQAHYLALALANFVCTLSPRRIILGGGVMDRGILFPLVRARLQALLNDYVQAPEILRDDRCVRGAAGAGGAHGCPGGAGPGPGDGGAAAALSYFRPMHLAQTSSSRPSSMSCLRWLSGLALPDRPRWTRRRRWRSWCGPRSRCSR